MNKAYISFNSKSASDVQVPSRLRSCALAGCMLLYAGILKSQHLPPAYGPLPSTLNFVRSFTQLRPISGSATIAATTDPLQVQQETGYFDALGRPWQSVARSAALNSAAGQTAPMDKVALHLYDSFGLEPLSYLPYPTAVSNGLFKAGNPFQQQRDFYTHADPNINPLAGQGQTFYYGKKIIESSPLNRVLETYAPGNSWVGTESGAKRSVKVNTCFNTLADSVRIWMVTNTSRIGLFGSYQSPGIYPAGRLAKNITTDEHGVQRIEFTDENGKPILKKMQLTALADPGSGRGHDGWICTYYLYDDLGNLRCTVQPEGVRWLNARNWDLSNATILSEQCFRYEYDHRQRVIMKKVPGMAEAYMVYDHRDRLVLTQDGHLRERRQWLYTWYDALNRPVATGTWATDTVSFATHISRAMATPASVYRHYPDETAAGRTELTRTFYDAYAWLSAYTGHGLTGDLNAEAGFSGTELNVFPYARALVRSSKTAGLITGSRTRVVGSDQWITSVIVYDDMDRQIQVKVHNQLAGSTETVTTQYGFAGQVLRQVKRQVLSAPSPQTLVVVTENKFDQIGRISRIDHRIGHSQINNGALSAAKTIATLEYDALGQVRRKNIGTQPGTAGPLETLTYDYNIRGWLLGVNRSYVTQAGSGSPGAGRWFGFDLGYDQTANASGLNYLQTQFNGNISGQSWRSAGDQVARQYRYSYDAVNRLLRGDFVQNNGSWGKSLNFDSFMGDGQNPHAAYDLNGNIRQMQQWGWAGTGNMQIDNLRYTYQQQDLSNRLRNVVDGFNQPTTTLGDFRTSTLHPQAATKPSADRHTIDDYAYDVNGNMTRDLNKDIGSATANGITYNYMNLPEVVTVRNASGGTKGTITYAYDATGNKIRKTVVETGAVVAGIQTAITTATTYIGGSVYESKTYNPLPAGMVNYTNQLQFLSQEEGRVRPMRSNPQDVITGMTYDYMLKDHLGNVRMVLTEEAPIIRYPATTLEGTVGGTANSLVNQESKFYRIIPAHIVPETSIPSWGNETGTTKDYLNHNGNPPANDGYPANAQPLTTAKSTQVYRLNAATNKTGLEFMIKVMAGDRIDILGNSYYLNTGSITNANSSSLDWLSLFAGMLATPLGALSSKNITTGSLQTLNAGLIPNTFIRGNNNEPATTVPKAYINYMFFDEQLRYCGGNFSRVGANGVVKRHWISDPQLQNVLVPKNGFVYVYVSNESNLPVYFDNLQVIHKPGPLAEETHYYPFGLTMAGISSKAAGKMENRFKYNSKEEQRLEFSDGSGLEWYDFGARMYDVQVGRWNVVDPSSEKGFYFSPNNFGFNNPISFIDPDGRWPIYSAAGKYLGDDGKKEKGKDLAYLGVAIKDEKGKITGYEGLQLLTEDHNQFQIISNIVKQEGSTLDPKEYLWIAHASNNAAKESNSSLYKKLMTKFSSVASGKKTPLSTKDNSQRATSARLGVIDVITGGADPTGNATLWDGTDFLAWGLNSPNGTPQNKFEEYKHISISSSIYDNYLNGNLKKYRDGFVSYYGKKYTIPEKVFYNMTNWNDNCDFEYITGKKLTYNLIATGTVGHTIFWKKQK